VKKQGEALSTETKRSEVSQSQGSGDALYKKLSDLLDNMNRVLIGQSRSVKLAATAFLAGGHVLLEDVPGVGKTLLAKTLAKSVRANFKRIQCTPDLLPSDISGVSVYSQKDGTFSFVPGPIFTNILLADEINRATPRTQSSLLEAMEESQVTIEGETRSLPDLFFVIATQNPIEYHGTFPLPEAQIDRFMLSLSLGYPKPEEEMTLLVKTLQDGAFEAASVLSVEEVLQARVRARQVFVEKSIQRYIVDIVNSTRNHPLIVLGVSPRGSQLLMRAAQAAALLSERDYVKPEDIQLLAPPVFGHRIIPRHKDNKVGHAEIIEQVLAETKVPV
jgi:MoxR-like ATPase